MTSGRSTSRQEIDLVLGRGFLLSAHPLDWDPRARPPFKSGLASILQAGPDHLLWAVFDEIVDGYFPFADRLEDEIDDASRTRSSARPRSRRSTRCSRSRRELIAVRRAVSPVREILNQLTNRDLTLIDAREVLYFRDIYDHVIRLTDELDTDRELVAATVEIYLSPINNNLSTIMKRLTGVTVILAGIGAIAGIFGMSEAGAGVLGRRGARLLGGHRRDGRRSRRSRPCSSAGSTGSRAGAAEVAGGGSCARLSWLGAPVSRRPAGWPSGGRRRGRPGRAEELRDDLQLGPRALRALRGLEPQLLGRRGERPRRGSAVAADLGDRVQEDAGCRSCRPPRCSPSISGPLLILRGGQQRQEHPVPGVGVQVGRPAEAGLAEVLDEHRDVAERVGRRVRRPDDRQVDAEALDHAPGSRRGRRAGSGRATASARSDGPGR